MDYDCKDNLAYFSDMTAGTITSITYNGLNKKVVLKDLSSPEGEMRKNKNRIKNIFIVFRFKGNLFVIVISVMVYIVGE